jgi:hypothetical protein
MTKSADKIQKTVKIYLSKALCGYWIDCMPGWKWIEEDQLEASFSPFPETADWVNLPSEEVEVPEGYDLAESVMGRYFLYNASGKRLDVNVTKKGEIYFW